MDLLGAPFALWGGGPIEHTWGPIGLLGVPFALTRQRGPHGRPNGTTNRPKQGKSDPKQRKWDPKWEPNQGQRNPPKGKWDPSRPNGTTNRASRPNGTLSRPPPKKPNRSNGPKAGRPMGRY